MRLVIFLSNSVLLFEFVWILYGGNVNIVYPPSCNLNLCCTQIVNLPARFSFQFALKRLWGYVVMFQFDRWYYCRDKTHLIRITWMKRHKRTPTNALIEFVSFFELIENIELEIIGIAAYGYYTITKNTWLKRLLAKLSRQTCRLTETLCGR